MHTCTHTRNLGVSVSVEFECICVSTVVNFLNLMRMMNCTRMFQTHGDNIVSLDQVSLITAEFKGYFIAGIYTCALPITILSELR